MDMSRQELEISCFDLVELLREVHSGHAGAAAEKGQRFTLRHDGMGVLRVCSDRARLQRLFGHLVDNAIKFTQQGGAITFTTETLEQTDSCATLRFTVADNGPGIRPELADRVFEPFEQVESSLTRTHGGAGLGLAIVKLLLDQFAGSIVVHSDEGAGSAFHIELQLQLCDSCEDAPEQQDRDFTGKRILLVEDNEVNAMIVQSILEETRAQVDIAPNGRKALEMVMDNRPVYGLIFMDIQMPVLDGYDATREIRALQSPRLRSIPIVALTSNSFAEDVTRCRQAGMNGHLAKPVDPDQLLAVAQSFLKRDMF